MPRYIDADAVLDVLRSEKGSLALGHSTRRLLKTISIINEIPTADVVEIETIKDWLYKIAINNVGCGIDGDFSDACEEIISRLDGLRNFAKERGGEK